MNKFIAFTKILLNIVLFVIYSLFGIIFGNFLYGFYVKHILQQEVPGSHDWVHYKLAIVSIIVVFLLTFLLRRFLYLEVFSKRFLEEEYEKNSVYRAEQKVEKKSYTQEKTKIEKEKSNEQDLNTQKKKVVYKEEKVVEKKHDSDNDLEIYVNKEI